MKTRSTAFKEAYDQDGLLMDAKVVIEFGNNRFNDNQVVTSSSNKLVNRGLAVFNGISTRDFWSGEEAFNSKNRNTMKWLVCDQGAKVHQKEDGLGYRALNLNDKTTEKGWWSSNKSDSSGLFSSPEWVQSTFDNRVVNKIQLYTTEGYSNMRQVSVQYRNSVGTWVSLAANYFLSESVFQYTWDLGSDITISGLRVYVHRTFKANDYARISELQGTYVKDVTQYVASISISEVQEEYEGSIPVGKASANTFSISFDNTEGLFNIHNTSSPYSFYMGVDNKVIIDFGIEPHANFVYDGTANNSYGGFGYGYGDDIGITINLVPDGGVYGVEGQTYGGANGVMANLSPSRFYIRMGEFYSDDWTASSDNLEVVVSGRDFSKFLQEEDKEFGRIWMNTDVRPAIRSILARAGLSSDQIEMDSDSRVFPLLYIKGNSFWNFLGEVSLVDRAFFGFKADGKFYYKQYSKLDTNTEYVYDFSDDTNVEKGSLKTELYVNRIIANVSNITKQTVGRSTLWSLGSEAILGWAKSAGSVADTVETIAVQQGPNQKSGGLTDNGWPKYNGYFWVPTTGEIVHYTERDETSFKGCKRGFANTLAQTIPDGSYLGEVRVFDIDFDKSPAYTVDYPYVTAINFLEEDLLTEAQAKILDWTSNAFGGKLIIGNKVPWYTWLSGNGQTYDDFQDNANGISEITFALSVAGLCIVETAGGEQVGLDNQETVENKNQIRRNGKNEIQIDSPWIQSREHAVEFINQYINEYKTPRQVVEIEAMGYPALELVDRVRLVSLDQLSITNKQFHIIGINYEFDGTLTTTYTFRQVKS
jgi:hypothetical protein